MTTMATKFPDTQAVPEGSTRKYTAQLLDLDGVALQSGQVSSILFSLRDARSGSVINSRHRVQVRNANGGTLSTAGVFGMIFNEADTVAVGSAKMQLRRVLFEVTFTYGTENHEVFFYVENLSNLPPALTLVGQPNGEANRISDGNPLVSLV